MKILDLSLKYIWYDMIERGEKTEEYREVKPFYQSRLIVDYHGCKSICSYCPCFGNVCPIKDYDAVRFHRGQGGKETMLFECKGITIGYGKPKWGAPENRTVFIIRLGERIK